MAARSNAARKAVDTVTQGVRKKLTALLTKAPYEAPKVISFSIDGMTSAETVSYTGNT